MFGKIYLHIYIVNMRYYFQSHERGMAAAEEDWIQKKIDNEKEKGAVASGSGEEVGDADDEYQTSQEQFKSSSSEEFYDARENVNN